MTANETMDLQYFGYLSGPSRNLGERESDGRERERGGEAKREEVDYRSSETYQIC